MANTTNPVGSSYQLFRHRPVGDGHLYNGRSYQPRYTNCHPVMQKEVGADPVYQIVSRLPVRNHFISTNGSSTDTYNILYANKKNDVDPYLWYVQNLGGAGPRLFRRYLLSNAIPEANIGALSADPVAFGEYRVGSTQYTIVLSDDGIGNTHLDFISSFGAAISSTTTENFGGVASDMVVMDGYIFISIGPDNAGLAGTGQRIYNSVIGVPTDPFSTTTDFIDAEMDPDASIRRLAKHKNHLVAFGSRSTEFFYNAAVEIGSPLKRQANYAKNLGIYASSYVAAANDTIYFLGAFNGAFQGLYKLEDFGFQKVSDAYFDAWFNDNVVGSNVGCYPYLVNGEICVLVYTGTRANSSYKHILYIPSLQTFIEMSFAKEFGATALTEGINGQAVTMMVPNYPPGGVVSFGAVADTDTIAVGQGSVETFTATIVTPYEGYNNNSKKTNRHLDLLGTFGANAIALEYSKDLEYNNWVTTETKTQDTTGQRDPLRWRNLGQYTQQAYKFSITVTEPFTYLGTEEAYYQGIH